MEGHNEADTDEVEQHGLTESNLSVHSGGKISVPDPVQEALGIGTHDAVSVRLHLDGEDAHFTRNIHSDGRKITIPARIRNNRELGGDVTATFSKPVIA